MKWTTLILAALVALLFRRQLLGWLCACGPQKAEGVPKPKPDASAASAPTPSGAPDGPLRLFRN